MVFNYFPFRHVTDILPTCLRHLSPTFISDIYIGITATLPPLLPPKRNLHRHLHRQNSSNLQRSHTNCKLITFPKLSQKREEGERRKKQVYTLLYKGIHRKKMARIILLNINNLSVSLCKLRLFHYAS